MTAGSFRRSIRILPTVGWICLALLAALLSTTFLSAAAPGGPGASDAPADMLDETEHLEVQDHRQEADPYTAQGLLQARWDTGAVQASWTHRPVWQSPVTGAGVRVAVIDTGVDAGHPDLQGRVVAWRDFVNGRDEAYDDTGHGTHVAGIIAAGGHPQLRPDRAYFLTGARGLAPDAQIIAAKAMDEKGRGDPDRIAEAILWALEEGAHVINLSLGISLPPAEDPDEDGVALPGRDRLPFSSSSSMHRVEEAIQIATERGAVVVVAAGNHDAGEAGSIMFPGTMSEVITVGAVDPAGRPALFSNSGTPGSGKPDLVAPGVVVSTSPRDPGTSSVATYRGLGGTSMSAPFVAGTIALIMEARPVLMEQSEEGGKSGNMRMVRDLLVRNAQPIPGASDTGQGAGLLRVDAALEDAGTGEAGVRPAAFAAPVVAGLGGFTWVRHRSRRQGRRHPTHGAGGTPAPSTGGTGGGFGPHSPGGVALVSVGTNVGERGRSPSPSSSPSPSPSPVPLRPLHVRPSRVSGNVVEGPVFVTARVASANSAGARVEGTAGRHRAPARGLPLGRPRSPLRSREAQRPRRPGLGAGAQTRNERQDRQDPPTWQPALWE